tara:strand:+ start:899 stop:1648 length:750 start_codon:yes stop_codon:yes gene_type:complete
MKYVKLKSFFKKNNVKFYYKDHVNSTMEEAKKIHLSNYQFLIFESDSQKNGRGRLSNNWISKSGNIFFTIKILTKKDPKFFFQLGIITAIEIKKTIELFNIQKVKLKWPNDIFIENEKIGGILIESFYQNQYKVCLVGVGINFLSSPQNLNYKTNYLKKYNNKIDKNDFIQTLYKNILNAYIEWDPNINSHLIKNYKKNLMYLGQQIKITNNKKIIYGKFYDITNEGYAIVEIRGKKEIIFSGSIELLQ